jgi:hypothetical protein
MCLVIDQNKHKRNKRTFKYIPLIAKTDITVYKVMYIPHDDVDGYPQAPYRNDSYTSPVLQAKIQSSTALVGQGIHAYQTRERAKAQARRGKKAVECIVPQGTKYYLGYGYEIVSECLIFHGKPFK